MFAFSFLLLISLSLSNYSVVAVRNRGNVHRTLSNFNLKVVEPHGGSQLNALASNLAPGWVAVHSFSSNDCTGSVLSVRGYATNRCYSARELFSSNGYYYSDSGGSDDYYSGNVTEHIHKNYVAKDSVHLDTTYSGGDDYTYPASVSMECSPSNNQAVMKFYSDDGCEVHMGDPNTESLNTCGANDGDPIEVAYKLVCATQASPLPLPADEHWYTNL